MRLDGRLLERCNVDCCESCTYTEANRPATGSPTIKKKIIKFQKTYTMFKCKQGLPQDKRMAGR